MRQSNATSGRRAVLKQSIDVIPLNGSSGDTFTLLPNDHNAGYKRTAVVLAICALLGNYGFVASVYVSSQLAQHAYAMKFWLKSLIQYPFFAALGFALVLLPSLLLVTLFAPRLLSRLGSKNSRIVAFAICTLAVYLMVATILQLAVYHRLAVDTQGLILLALFLGVGAAVSMALPHRRNAFSE